MKNSILNGIILQVEDKCKNDPVDDENEVVGSSIEIQIFHECVDFSSLYLSSMFDYVDPRNKLYKLIILLLKIFIY